MEHPRIPTTHCYDLTQLAAQEVLQISLLSIEFGPRGYLLRKTDLLKVLKGTFQVPNPESSDATELLALLLDLAADSGNYQICILQRVNRPDAGWVCLLPQAMLPELMLIKTRHHFRSNLDER